MKKLIITCLFLCSITTYGQLKDRKLQSIDITGGYAENGFGAKISYSRHITKSIRNDYLQISGLFTMGDIESDIVEENIPYMMYGGSVGYYFNFSLDRREKYNLNIGGGAVAGVEQLNNDKNNLGSGAVIDVETGFIYGGYIGVDFDIYLAEQISILISLTEYYHINSNIGNFTPYAGGGIRIFL